MLATAHASCPICIKPIGMWLIKKRSTSNSIYSQMIVYPGTFRDAGWDIEELWPKPAASSVPQSVPSDIARNFFQAEHAAQAGHRESAGMTYRRVLELTMKDKFPTGKGTLAKRIESYASAGGLTAAMKEWADTVREIGNETAHDTTEPAQADIDDLGSFTRVMLEYLYTMPAKVAARTPTPPVTGSP